MILLIRNVLQKTVLIVGIATTSLYWFLGIGREQFSTIKYILLLSAFFYYFIYFFIQIKFRFKEAYNHIFNNWWGILIISIIFFSFFPFYKGNWYHSYYFYSRFLTSLIIVICFYFFTIYEKQTIVILHYSALLVAFACFTHVFLTMFSININNLSNTRFTFNSIGFGTITPNWSDGLSLYSILPPCYAILKKKPLKIFLIYFFLSVNTILFSQILAGGRAGISASCIMLVLFVFIYFPVKKSIPILFFLIINILIIIKISLPCSNYNILRGTPLAKKSFLKPFDIACQCNNRFVTFDKNSSYNKTTFFALRDEMTAEAVKLIFEQPITGYGFGTRNFHYESMIYEYHNVFLKYGVAGGLLFLISLFTFAIYPIIFSLKKIIPLWNFNYLDNNNMINQMAICSIIIFGGIYISMFSPRYIYGGVNVSFIWWACYGCFLGLFQSYSKQKEI